MHTKNKNKNMVTHPGDLYLHAAQHETSAEATQMQYTVCGGGGGGGGQ